MATMTKTSETSKMMIIVTLTRDVNEQVAYMDGYNLKTGKKQIHESYDVKITGKQSGQSITFWGQPGQMHFCRPVSQMRTSAKLPAGVYARAGDAYISRETYDAVMALVAELDAEMGKTTEQVEVETANAQREARIAAMPKMQEPAHGDNGYCRKCHSYCYGDCEAN